MKKIIWILFLSLSSASFAKAQVEQLQASPELDTLMDSIINRIPIFLGALAVLAILYSGAMYVLAMGDPTKMESAKKNITWVIMGIIAVALVYLIIRAAVWLTSRNPF